MYCFPIWEGQKEPINWLFFFFRFIMPANLRNFNLFFNPQKAKL